jgi:hypothetical protein
MFRFSYKMFWSDTNEIPSLYTTSQILLFPWTRSFIQPTVSCVAYWWMYGAFSISNKGNPASELVKPLKNLCALHCLRRKSYFKHLKSFCHIGHNVSIKRANQKYVPWRISQKLWWPGSHKKLWCGLNWSGSGQGQVVSSFKHSNELLVPYNTGNNFPSWATISCSSRTLLCAVS